MSPSKKDWILLALGKVPLDRIRLMKTLFLVWNRRGRKIEGYFNFVPYLYGPCSFEVYAVLDNLHKDGLIAQPPHPVQQWANYYLTDKGKAAAENATKNIKAEVRKLLEEVAQDVSQIGFYELLRKVYSEAPDFARNSVMGGIPKR